MAESNQSRDEGWWHDALCIDTDPEVFFGRTSKAVKAICKKCDVEEECKSDRLVREAGLSRIDIFGFQGGITSAETIRRLGKLAT